ncbi:unnamed protein product, partial [Rotaria sp. Silwood2]
ILSPPKFVVVATRRASFTSIRLITVIGIGVGLESNGVCLSFNDWIIAQNPRLICDTLVNWSNEQSDGRTSNDPLYHLDRGNIPSPIFLLANCTFRQLANIN